MAKHPPCHLVCTPMKISGSDSSNIIDPTSNLRANQACDQARAFSAVRGLFASQAQKWRRSSRNDTSKISKLQCWRWMNCTRSPAYRTTLPHSACKSERSRDRLNKRSAAQLSASPMGTPLSSLPTERDNRTKFVAAKCCKTDVLTAFLVTVTQNPYDV